QDGFANQAEVVASLWAYDALAPQDTLPGLSGVLIDFTEGDLGSSFNGTWDVTVKSTFAPIKNNVYENLVKAALVPKTGVFKGVFDHPSIPGVKTKYQGVMLQDSQTGEGAFLGTVNGGKVTVSPAPVAP
ncbi:MAG: hypothetical protein H0X66_21800, partial [Verrucomicrobia bacterium]|nr:hypothetical protein [Verrucomicrobiota bacterium]